MASNQERLEFFYQELEVGVFEEPEYPNVPGRYRYMPYRGPGHYEMATALREGSTPRCSYVAGSKHFTFDVIATPEYGILELSNIEELNG